MNVKIESSWKNILQEEFNKPYFKDLTQFVKKEYEEKMILPPAKDIFQAFDLCPFNKVKVVILGQDPYHGVNQAHGLCFSVNKETPLPPSLLNIYKELRDDLAIPIPSHGYLKSWAEQGIFMPNATLTVVAHHAGSHQKKGWETFTDEVIRLIAEKKENIVFILWGAFAQNKAWMIDENKHLILKAPHPSPLSAHRGFFGSKPFSKTNAYLKKCGIEKINWNPSDS